MNEKRREIERKTIFTGNTDDPEEMYRNKIPCEFCEELIDLEDLTYHQV